MSKKALYLSESLVSNATKRNWSKLFSSPDTKLTSRANKKLSQKKIVPFEYFNNINNLPFIQQFTEYVKTKNYQICDVLFSVVHVLLLRKNILHEPHVQTELSRYPYKLINEILNWEFPTDESDILGIIYQCLLNEGIKNISGAYYTCPTITCNMTKDLDFSLGQLFLDPCCGSGAFLLAIKNAKPEQLFGIDNDPIAVMLARFNLLLKYSNKIFEPQIECLDYLKESISMNGQKIFNQKYDYVITNPPWGASSDIVANKISSRESFALFFVKAFKQTAARGFIRFLFPESILTVKKHKEIRKYILENCALEKITYYDVNFSGVTTKCIDILCSNNEIKSSTLFVRKGSCNRVNISNFFRTDNYSFNYIETEDISIVEHVKRSNQTYYLSDSLWALGVVTGDNKNKLSAICLPGMEKIYTGKDILPYRLKCAQNYLNFDRNELQQVAKDEYYRAKEKLVYKFISNKLVFAYDNTGSLFLNSANILIPKIPNMSVKTVMAFLNSELYQFLYMILFSEIKVLKGNLMKLPFPSITPIEDSLLSSYVDIVLSGDESYIDKIQTEIYKIVKIDNKQRMRIKEKLYGTFNK